MPACRLSLQRFTSSTSLMDTITLSACTYVDVLGPQDMRSCDVQ